MNKLIHCINEGKYTGFYTSLTDKTILSLSLLDTAFNITVDYKRLVAYFQNEAFRYRVNDRKPIPKKADLAFFLYNE